MRSRAPFQSVLRHPRLWSTTRDDRSDLWSAALGDPPSVYGERISRTEGTLLRYWDPMRSKLSAAIHNGYEDRLPLPGESWLYLGAASGTTASHVADLVTETGVVVAVERSVRPFAALLHVADRYPNLVPVLGDALDPDGYAGSVPMVDGLYVDVAQPEIARIVVENGRRYLRRTGAAIVVVKASGMGRDESPKQHLDRAIASLARVGEVGAPIRLEPFHRHHYLVTVLADRRWFADPGPETAPVTTRRVRRGS